MLGCKCSNDLLSKLTHFFLSGRELTQGHQLGLAGGVSFPVFWLAGAGSAVFWILGEFFTFISLYFCVFPQTVFLKLSDSFFIQVLRQLLSGLMRPFVNWSRLTWMSCSWNLFKPLTFDLLAHVNRKCLASSFTLPHIGCTNLTILVYAQIGQQRSKDC